MAYEPTTENETPWEDHGIDHDDDDDEEYTTPRSSPMKPPPTPEEIEMSQLPREQNGWRRQQEQQAAWVDLKDMYPQANEDALEVSYVKVPGKEPRLSIKMAGSTRAYWLFEPNLFGRWIHSGSLLSPRSRPGSRFVCFAQCRGCQEYCYAY